MTTNSFLSRICARADEAPDATFAWVHVGDRYETLTQRQVIGEAWRFATWLKSRGIRPGAVVFLILQHCPQLYTTYLGAMLAGAVPCFLPFPNPKQDPELYWESQRKVFERTRSTCLVTYSELVPEINAVATEIGMKVFDVAELEGLEADGDAPDPAGFADDDSIALLQHSSGTTGLKKGIALSYKAIAAQIDAYSTGMDLWSQLPDVRIASWLPLYHDGGLIACFMLPAYLGIPVVSLDAFAWVNHPTLLLEAIERFSATHVWLPNFAFQHLVTVTPPAAQYDLSSLRTLISTGEIVRAETLDRFLTRFEEAGITRETFESSYGMAETVLMATHTPPNGGLRVLDVDPVEIAVDGRAAPLRKGAHSALRVVSNGRPLPGMEVRIVRDGEPAGEDTVGEIYVRSPYLFSGYFQDPETTAQSFDDDWYRTGDLGFVSDDEVFVTGRIKDLLIINGANYFAHDLEAAVSQVDGVKPGRCVALGVYNPDVGSEQLVVIAERDDGAEPLDDPVRAQDINRAVWRRFGIGPGDVRLVGPGWIVKTTSGKMSRSENVVKYERLRDRAGERGGQVE
jgi:fatty-acyl-CoA synthase